MQTEQESLMTKNAYSALGERLLLNVPFSLKVLFEIASSSHWKKKTRTSESVSAISQRCCELDGRRATVNSWIVHPGWTISNRQAGKLWRARSRLYQRQFLQVNSHFSGFFEIYQIHIPSHPCKFKIYSFLNFFSFFARNSAIFRDFAEFSLFFFENLKEFCRNSGKY